MTLLVHAARMLTPEGLLEPGWIRVSHGRITGTATGDPPYPADLSLGSGILSPGFVDAHIHGGGGSSFSEGTQEAAETVIRAHLAQGTTTMMASLVTDEHERLRDILGELTPLVESGRLAGVHLEGPWLSPQHSGAHDAGLLENPEQERVADLLRTGVVRMVTLAPELPGGFDAIRQLVAAGIVAAIGHTDATYDQARTALDAGATVGSHLFNAMRGIHHREPGPVVALLERPEAFVELIADAVHVHPAALALAARAKPGRCVLVTDAMAAAAAGDGEYRLGPMHVRVQEGVARLVDTGAIAGSTLTMATAVRCATEVVGLPIADVLMAATANPAAMLGLTEVGRLRSGARADLVVLDDALQVQQVMRGGAWVL